MENEIFTRQEIIDKFNLQTKAKNPQKCGFFSLKFNRIMRSIERDGLPGEPILGYG